MGRAGLAALAAVMVLTACGSGGSRFNPFSWFGRDRSEAPTLAPEGGYDRYTDRRGLVAEVTRMQVDRAPGGAIVTAIGLPPSLGWWDADLIPQVSGIDDRPIPENGVLTLNFRLLPPPETRPGAPRARELSASIFVSDQVLAEVRTITVRAQANQRSSRR